MLRDECIKVLGKEKEQTNMPEKVFSASTTKVEIEKLGVAVSPSTLRIKKFRILPVRISLADALAQELVNENGEILDRITGRRLSLEGAIEGGIIDPNIQEIVDTKADVKVTIVEAIQRGIVDAFEGFFIDFEGNEKIPFVLAGKKYFIRKPRTFKDLLEEKWMVSNTEILSPLRKRKLTLKQAMDAGVLDGSHLKSILKVDSGDYVTLTVAIDLGIIEMSTGRFTNTVSGDILTISQAIDYGFLVSVEHKSIFNVPLFRHLETFLSLREAIERHILDLRRDSEFMLKYHGKDINLVDCVDLGLILRRDLMEILTRRLKILAGKSILSMIREEMLDIDTGLVRGGQNEVISYEQAINENILTVDGAILIHSLMNLTIKTGTTRFEKGFNDQKKSFEMQKVKKINTKCPKNFTNTMYSNTKILMDNGKVYGKKLLAEKYGKPRDLSVILQKNPKSTLMAKISNYHSKTYSQEVSVTSRTLTFSKVTTMKFSSSSNPRNYKIMRNFLSIYNQPSSRIAFEMLTDVDWTIIVTSLDRALQFRHIISSDNSVVIDSKLILTFYKILKFWHPELVVAESTNEIVDEQKMIETVESVQSSEYSHLSEVCLTGVAYFFAQILPDF